MPLRQLVGRTDPSHQLTAPATLMISNVSTSSFLWNKSVRSRRGTRKLGKAHSSYIQGPGSQLSYSDYSIGHCNMSKYSISNSQLNQSYSSIQDMKRTLHLCSNGQGKQHGKGQVTGYKSSQIWRKGMGLWVNLLRRERLFSFTDQLPPVLSWASLSQ